MYPPSSRPMGAATVARRAGLLAQSRPGGSWARARTWGAGVAGCYSTTPSAARRRLQLVAALGVRESSLPALEEAAIDLVDEVAYDPAEIPPPPDAPDAKTVRVKFVLKKQCAFGQQFLVVGDDPALGLWDPAKAAVLDWSDGHVWMVKTDLPANKKIEFKFLLRDASGHIRWQHGANRILQTIETQNTLVVHEDWDHVKNQRVSEEPSVAAEDITLFSDDLVAGSTAAMLANHDILTGEVLKSNKSAAVDTPLQRDREMDAAKEDNQPQFILEEDQKILNKLHLHGKKDSAPQNGYLSVDDNARPNEDDDTAMCREDAQIASSTTSIFENDLAWARNTLHQLLRFLGFQIGTTKA